ncbi:N-acetylglucosamine kinase-like BadF-type ATPase [Scopulibacillus darangshiensis]|uniref:N-acetylglucosamine kinase-like BadF-type ATPase n=1 Tax=Scopulibacillus darangshiensis TaxID=442528 RepID=A0A4R2P2Q5_9BACL|nr:BadF/BadG/BcrA/BcrD ATPase family protein [Scopulibacillus darangshiensis]TCP28857.1 N-acetylglucosamine kinase-like BadF-type ATPase [Scopulibacillus darangshiensis]
MTSYFLAIDGGGTKTDVALFDSDGRVLNRIVGESTNPNAISGDQVAKNFTGIFNGLFNNHPVPIAYCFAGMSGCGHVKQKAMMKDYIRAALPVPCKEIEIENDAINALWSGTDGGPGFVVIAGTGTIAYGRNESGEDFRIGGWGHLVGDEGSGYDIGKEAVRAMLRAYDRRQGPTDLTARLTSHFRIQHVPDVIPIIYHSPKQELANLVSIVDETARLGDKTAAAIIERSASALIELIETGISMSSDKSDPEIVLTGGLWKSSMLRRNVIEHFTNHFIFPKCPPVYGSMVGALNKLENNDIILQRLKGYFA